MSDKIARTEPDFLYTMQVFATSISYDLNCHRVGKIVNFYPETLTCDVELLELKPNQGRLDKYALFQGLPVMIEGGIDTNLTFGDITGSECVIHFNDRDIDAWFDTGEAYQPNSQRLHSFSDGFVSLRPHNKNDVFQYEMDGTVLNNGATKIKLADDGSVTITNATSTLSMSEDTVQITNGSCTWSMSGDTITVTGKVVINGDTMINGKLNVSGEIKSDIDVKATEISLLTHTHTFTQAPAGEGVTNPPQ